MSDSMPTGSCPAAHLYFYLFDTPLKNASDIRLENKGMDREKAHQDSFRVYKYNIKHTSHREHVETLPTQPPE
jgi:hypothetical protein